MQLTFVDVSDPLVVKAVTRNQDIKNLTQCDCIFHERNFIISSLAKQINDLGLASLATHNTTTFASECICTKDGVCFQLKQISLQV